MWIILFIILFVLYTISAKAKNPLIEKIRNNYTEIIRKNSLKFSIPVQRIISIIEVESGGDQYAVGTSGEIGLMQISRDALTDYNKVYKKFFTMDSLKFPENNIEVGTGYLAYLRQQFRGDINLATKAYNEGFTDVSNNNANGTDYLNRILNVENQLS